MRPIRLPLIAISALFALTFTACDSAFTGPVVHTSGPGTTGSSGTGSQGGGNSGGGTSTPSGPTNPMVVLTNQARAANGLKPLTENALLDKAAALLCAEISQTHSWAHEQPGTTYPTSGERVDAVGYHWTALVENLAGTTGLSTSQIFDGWMASPGHHANIMNSDVTDIGIASQPIGTQLCSVQVFASR